jgi:hypothetical protein
MYDLEICLPVSGSGKYFNRLLDFKRYGLLNVRCKIKLVLLCGNEKIPNLEQDWPDGVDAISVSNRTNYVTSKICDYYLKTLNEHPLNARWYFKIDDDSVNDISGLINNLDRYFDHTDACYLAAYADENFGQEEHDTLERVGLSNVLSGMIPCFHEWEACIISRAAIEKINNCPTAQSFLKSRAELQSGPGDQSISIAALLAKVYPMHCPFISKDPILEEFSYFGGNLNHVHYIARDIDFGQFQLLVCKISPKIALEEGYLNVNNDLYRELLNSDYVFYNSNKTTLGIIRFLEPCIIGNYSHPNEIIWKIKDDKLQFIGIDGRPTTIFEKIDNGNLFSGPVIGTDVKHYLRKLISIDK